MTRLLRTLTGSALGLLAGCASHMNPPFPASARVCETADAGACPGYRYESLATGARNGDEVFIVLTLSGGGTRAAAFGYGVIRALAAQRIAGGRTMLDEVDVVSSVSGGSFAAAYLGLFGPTRFLDEFPDAVLYRKLESGIAGRVLLPWNWFRLMSPRFARSDLAAEYYDDVLFEHRTFATMPRHRPFIVLNATDIVEGAQFSFTQPHFDRLCSDLNPVPVAFGVTASSAFPVAFTPLTLTNYHPKSRCGYRAPSWVETQSRPENAETHPRGYLLAKTWQTYENERREYLHLSDGGLSDNIGLRAPYTALTMNEWGISEAIMGRRVRHIIAIVVDAKPKGESAHDGSARAPWFGAVLKAAGTNPMENYSAETVELTRALFDEWQKAGQRFRIQRDRCRQLCRRQRPPAACEARCRRTFHVDLDLPEPTLHLVHVRFDAMEDGAEKTALQQVDTRLQLSRHQVDELIEWGGTLLVRSPAYAEAVSDIAGGKPVESSQRRAPGR